QKAWRWPGPFRLGEGERRHEGERERQRRRLAEHGNPILGQRFWGQEVTRLSDEMFNRFIISWRVVGLTCNSSAARFCTPPHYWRARMIICRSYSLTASLKEMPLDGRVGGSRPADSRWRTEDGSSS